MFEFHGENACRRRVLDFCRLIKRFGSTFARSKISVNYLDGDPLKGQGGKPGSVLLADAEEGVRQSLRHLLEPCFRVFAAESGEQAVEIVRREEPDVVVLDLEIP